MCYACPLQHPLCFAAFATHTSHLFTSFLELYQRDSSFSFQSRGARQTHSRQKRGSAPSITQKIYPRCESNTRFLGSRPLLQGGFVIFNT